jgi:hypothetical protein
LCPDVVHHVLALYSLSEESAVEFPRLLHQVCVDAGEGLWSPLPVTEFNFCTQHLEAFQQLRQGLNIGEVVLTVNETARSTRVVGEGSYLINGGLGGLEGQTRIGRRLEIIIG